MATTNGLPGTPWTPLTHSPTDKGAVQEEAAFYKLLAIDYVPSATPTRCGRLFKPPLGTGNAL